MFFLADKQVHSATFLSFLTFLFLSFSIVFIVSSTLRPNDEEPPRDESEASLEEEMKEVEEVEEVEEEEEEVKGDKEHIEEEGDMHGKDKEEEEELEEEDSLEWELRNNDSVFSELSELSRDYVESVDRGASVRGKFVKRQKRPTPYSDPMCGCRYKKISQHQGPCSFTEAQTKWSQTESEWLQTLEWTDIGF